MSSDADIDVTTNPEYADTVDETSCLLANSTNEADDVFGVDDLNQQRHDNSSLLVGNEDCSYLTVSSAICPQNSTSILRKWQTLARALEADEQFIVNSEKDILIHKKDINEVVIDMLETWRMKQCDEAKLSSLISILNQKGFKKAARDLRAKFLIENKIGEDFVSLNRAYIGVGFVAMILTTITAIVYCMKIQPAAPEFRKSLPALPAYYIPRYLEDRSRINSHMLFNAPIGENVLVFSGEDIYYRIKRLAQTADVEKIEYSLENGYISTNYITGISQISQFEYLCQIRNGKSIHWLKYFQDEFKWVRSCDKLDFVSSVVNISAALLHENELVSSVIFANHSINKSVLSYSYNNAIIVVGEQGIGKSTLLSQFGKILSNTHQNVIVVFSDVETFLNTYKTCKRSDISMKTAILKVFSSIVCANKQCEKYLIQSIPIGKVNLLVLLDGFDQLKNDDIEVGFQVINQIRQFNSTFLVVSSRPYLVNDLETHLKIMAFRIKSFSEESQKKLLTEFWFSRNKNLNKTALDEYSNNTIDYLKYWLNSTEDQFAGLALQTVLIGEVYEENATSFADMNNDAFTSNTQAIPIYTSTTLYSLFEYTVRKRFSLAETFESENRFWWFYHSYKAISSKFPSQPIPDRYNSQPKGLEKIGLLDHFDKSSNLKFIHPTFGDYFLSWYLVNCDNETLCELMSNTTFSVKKVTVGYDTIPCGYSFSSFSFSERLIVYFLDSDFKARSHLDDVLHSCSINKSWLLLAAIRDNFFTIIDLLKYNINEENSETMLKTIITYSHGWKMEYLLSAYNYTRLKPITEVYLYGTVTPVWRCPQITLLHLAMARVDEYVFENILKQAPLSKWGQHLLHFAVSDIHFSEYVTYGKPGWPCVKVLTDPQLLNPQQILQKQHIAGTLIKNSPSVLEENDEFFCTPIFHAYTYEILFYLLEKEKADSQFLCDKRFGNGFLTVLHLAAQKYSAENFHQTILHLESHNQLSYSLINYESAGTGTSLLEYVDKNEPLNKTLYIYQKAGANFSYSEKFPYQTIITKAIDRYKSIQALELLLTYQNNWREVGRTAYQTALTYSAIRNNIDALKFFIENSIEDIDSLDGTNKTALFNVVNSSERRYYDVVQVLLNNNANSEMGFGVLKTTPIHKAAQFGTFEIAKLLLNECGSICKRDLQNNTVLHYALNVAEETTESCRETQDQNLTVAYILQKRYANVNDVNSKNLTALEAIISTKDGCPKLRIHVMHTLISYGAFVDENIGYLCIRNAVMCPGHDIDDPDLTEKKYTGYIEDIKAGNLSRIDLYGDTLLHVATRSNCMNGVKYLVGKGIDVNLKDGNGHTALYYFRPDQTTGGNLIYEFLKERGAHV